MKCGLRALRAIFLACACRCVFDIRPGFQTFRAWRRFVHCAECGRGLILDLNCVLLSLCCHSVSNNGLEVRLEVAPRMLE